MGVKGYRHTEEAKKRIGLASLGNNHNLGRTASEETRQKMSRSMLGVHRGRKHSEQARLNMSLAHRGKKQSAETVAKRVAKLKGRKMPPRDETYKLKQRLSHLGKPCPQHVRAAVSANHRGRKRSAETRARMSAAQKARATTSNFYIDGRSRLRMHERAIACQTFEYKEWRRAVFVRDAYTCVECGQRGGRLHADHIKPWSTHPALRYEVSNGRTMCVPCHSKTPTYGFQGAKKARA